MMQKMRLHPDLGGDEANAQLLNQALATLLDPKKRALYDQWLQKHQPESLKPAKRSPGAQQHANVKTSRPSPEPSQPIDVELLSCAFCLFENHIQPLQTSRWGTPIPTCRQCKAPLTRLDKVEFKSSGELRRIHRSMVQTNCEIQVNEDQTAVIVGQVLDFSVLGLSIEHSDVFPKGLRVLIRSEKFDCVAAVSHSKSNKNGRVVSGLEILTLDLKLSRGDLFTASY